MDIRAYFSPRGTTASSSVSKSEHLAAVKTKITFELPDFLFTSAASSTGISSSRNRSSVPETVDDQVDEGYTGIHMEIKPLQVSRSGCEKKGGICEKEKGKNSKRRKVSPSADFCFFSDDLEETLHMFEAHKNNLRAQTVSKMDDGVKENETMKEAAVIEPEPPPDSRRSTEEIKLCLRKKMDIVEFWQNKVQAYQNKLKHAASQLAKALHELDEIS